MHIHGSRIVRRMLNEITPFEFEKNGKPINFVLNTGVLYTYMHLSRFCFSTFTTNKIDRCTSWGLLVL